MKLTNLIRFVSEHRPGITMGVGHYERLLLKHLADVPNPDFRFDITFSGRAKGQRLDHSRISPILTSARFAGISYARLENLQWPLASRLARGMEKFAGLADLYHCLSLAFPAPRTCPTIYTIHDLPCEHFDDEAIKPRWSRDAVATRYIHVPSDFAKQEIMQYLNVPDNMIRVIPYGCEHEVFNQSVRPMSCEELQQIGIEGPFVLYVGGFTKRKNVAQLLKAWVELSATYSEMQLVLVGPQERLRPLAVEVGAPRVVVAGYLDRQALPSLLRAAEILVCPSIYEGFGLPPLEAMACGVPAVAVRAGAIPEVVGDCAVLAENGSADALVSAVKQILDSESLCQDLRRRGPERAQMFSWSKHAAAMLQLYREALEL